MNEIAYPLLLSLPVEPEQLAQKVCKRQPSQCSPPLLTLTQRITGGR